MLVVPFRGRSVSSNINRFRYRQKCGHFLFWFYFALYGSINIIIEYNVSDKWIWNLKQIKLIEIELYVLMRNSWKEWLSPEKAEKQTKNNWKMQNHILTWRRWYSILFANAFDKCAVAFEFNKWVHKYKMQQCIMALHEH